MINVRDGKLRWEPDVFYQEGCIDKNNLKSLDRQMKNEILQKKKQTGMQEQKHNERTQTKGDKDY